MPRNRSAIAALQKLEADREALDTKQRELEAQAAKELGQIILGTGLETFSKKGLKQVAEDAVLNANYILRSMEDILHAPFAASGPCMHEALFSDDFLDGTGLSTLDLAKALIDEGFTDADIAKVMGGNVLRVLKAVLPPR